MIYLAFGAACLVTGLALACGGTSSGDSVAPGVKSGVAEDKPIEDLSAEEALRICEAFSESFRDVSNEARVVAGACTIDAAIESLFSREGVDVVECRSARDVCVAEGSASLLDRDDGVFSQGPECDRRQATDGFSGCQATVAELETCLSAMLESLRALFDPFSCEAFADGTTDLEGLEDRFERNSPLEEPPAGCDGLFKTCPDLFTASANQAETASLLERSFGSP